MTDVLAAERPDTASSSRTTTAALKYFSLPHDFLAGALSGRAWRRLIRTVLLAA